MSEQQERARTGEQKNDELYADEIRRRGEGTAAGLRDCTETAAAPQPHAFPLCLAIAA
ncbi:MAG TPA: hypothetical protein PKC78_02385 [Accumulibacter sp.]|nr:hypothetical protein [Accumulibacter sp.]